MRMVRVLSRVVLVMEGEGSCVVQLVILSIGYFGDTLDD